MELFEGQTIVFSFIFSKTDNYFKVFSEPKLYGNMLFLAVTQKISPCNFLGTQLECILSCSSVCFMLIKPEHETCFLSNRHFSTKTYRKWVITHSGSSRLHQTQFLFSEETSFYLQGKGTSFSMVLHLLSIWGLWRKSSWFMKATELLSKQCLMKIHAAFFFH